MPHIGAILTTGQRRCPAHAQTAGLLLVADEIVVVVQYTFAGQKALIGAADHDLLLRDGWPLPGGGGVGGPHRTEVQAMHHALLADGHRIVSSSIDGPFGRTFTFADPDGYHVTVHDRA